MITPLIPDQALQDLLDGLHQAGDTYMAALFTNAAALDASYGTYDGVGEASGSGYAAGGLPLSGRSSGVIGGRGYVAFTNPSWGPSVSITARALVIYNATRANKVLAILDFGQDYTATNGTFTPQLGSQPIFLAR